MLTKLSLPKPLIDNIILWCRTLPQGEYVEPLTWETEREEACDYKYHITGAYQITSPFEVQ